MAERGFTDDERSIWRAAYAAAFVAAFDRNEAEAIPYTRGEVYVGRFDRAAQCTTAERAITVADLAVHRLRQRRDAEQALAGVMPEALPKEWEDDG